MFSFRHFFFLGLFIGEIRGKKKNLTVTLFFFNFTHFVKLRIIRIIRIITTKWRTKNVISFISFWFEIWKIMTFFLLFDFFCPFGIHWNKRQKKKIPSTRRKRKKKNHQWYKEFDFGNGKIEVKSSSFYSFLFINIIDFRFLFCSIKCIKYTEMKQLQL